MLTTSIRRTRVSRFPRAHTFTAEALERRDLLSVTPAAIKVIPVRGHAVPVQAVESQSFSNTQVETFTADPAATFTAMINWGDKSTPTTGSVSSDGAGNFSVSGDHDYTKFGPYIIKITLTDNNGKNINLFSRAKITDAALSAGGTSFTIGKNTLFSGAVASFTDADPNAVATPRPTETALINWGDGTASAGTITQDTAGGSFTVSGKHAYAVAKTFTVTVSVRDPGGSKATATTTATVLPPQPTTTPTLIGDFKGKLQVNLFGVKTSHNFELAISNQDLTGLTGTVTIDGVQAISGAIPSGGVGELTNGNFQYTYNNGGIMAVISGHISSDGRHITSGFFSASGLPVPGLGSVHGTYTLDLQ